MANPYHTDYPPEKPVLVWDGKCGFCRYWIVRMNKLTEDKIRYEPYQKAGDQFLDIPTERFQRAVQLIFSDGSVYSGAGGVFKALDYTKHKSWLFKLYANSRLFQKTSESIYAWIAAHRKLSYKITKLLWGPDPLAPRTLWLLYIFAVLFVLVILLLTRW